MAGNVYGQKMERWVAQARSLGLTITVEDRSEGILQSVVVTLSRPQVDPQNALDVYQNSQRVVLHALRTFSTGKWTNTARYYSVAGGREVPLGAVKYTIESLARD